MKFPQTLCHYEYIICILMSVFNIDRPISTVTDGRAGDGEGGYVLRGVPVQHGQSGQEDRHDDTGDGGQGRGEPLRPWATGQSADARLRCIGQ